MAFLHAATHPVISSFPAISKNRVLLMMDSVSKQVSQHGPLQWLNYFEDTAVFYMASEGKIVFAGFEAAQKFIEDTLVHQLSAISLQWKDVHIDSLNEKTAAVDTYYHEDLKLSNDSAFHENGYCTAIVHLTSAGWKFRSLHWSVSK